MATAITTTPQDITGDFDLEISNPTSIPLVLMRQDGTGTYEIFGIFTQESPNFLFAKNTGTNSYRLNTSVDGASLYFTQ